MLQVARDRSGAISLHPIQFLLCLLLSRSIHAHLDSSRPFSSLIQLVIHSSPSFSCTSSSIFSHFHSIGTPSSLFFHHPFFPT
ncbi:hypothetical protein E2C01_092047 [Portunus trituberculatus]|uniref:Secreted protein n=1 Tax=Portunus trituberculatus TaxID=210409 RepID=A0A5B7JJ47_PORTR|nr:hypothetical protein [Portunus trituberculatus]